MKKEYIKVNKNAYDELAEEYLERYYSIKSDYYKRVMFKNIDFKENEKILEIGPGVGNMLKIFDGYGLNITAIELSEKMSKICQTRVPRANIINKDVLECEFNYQFDYIFMSVVIHCFPIVEARKVLKLIRKWLKDDGILICTTTVEENDGEGYELKKDYKKQQKRFRHRFTKESFDELFLQENFKIMDKKYKEEKDEIRTKMWQILYLKKY